MYRIPVPGTWYVVSSYLSLLASRFFIDLRAWVRACLLRTCLRACFRDLRMYVLRVYTRAVQ